MMVLGQLLLGSLHSSSKCHTPQTNRAGTTLVPLHHTSRSSQPGPVPVEQGQIPEEKYKPHGV